MGHLVAVDVGSGYVKAVSGDGLSGEDFLSGMAAARRVSFPSMVGEMPAGMGAAFGCENLPVIEYEGRVWLTGAHALEKIPQQHLADTLAHSWAGSVPWRVLLLRALADLDIFEGEVSLATGLPQSSYSERWRAIVSGLIGEHRAVVNGRKMHVHILRREGMILPQAAAGLYYWYGIDGRILRVVEDGGLVGGIDVGTLTTGFAVLMGGTPAPDLSSGVDVGMSMVARRVGMMFQKKYGVLKDFKGSMRLVENRRKIFVNGEMVDISDMVAEAVEAEVAGSLMNALSFSWGKVASEMEIGVYGGGAQDFFPVIQKVFPHARIVPVEAASGGVRFLPAMGMLYYLVMLNGLSACDSGGTPMVSGEDGDFVVDGDEDFFHEFEDGSGAGSDIGGPQVMSVDPADTVDVSAEFLRVGLRLYADNPLHAPVYSWLQSLPRDRRGRTHMRDHLLEAMRLYVAYVNGGTLPPLPRSAFAGPHGQVPPPVPDTPSAEAKPEVEGGSSRGGINIFNRDVKWK